MIIFMIPLVQGRRDICVRFVSEGDGRIDGAGGKEDSSET